jgi:hypothetical protein
VIEQQDLDDALEAVHGEIVPRDVGEFVSDDGFGLGRRQPGYGGGGKDEDGPDRSENNRNGRTGRFENTHCLAYAQAGGEMADDGRDSRAGGNSRRRELPRGKGPAAGRPNGEQRDANGPESQNGRQPAGIPRRFEWTRSGKWSGLHRKDRGGAGCRSCREQDGERQNRRQQHRNEKSARHCVPRLGTALREEFQREGRARTEQSALP